MAHPTAFTILLKPLAFRPELKLRQLHPFNHEGQLLPPGSLADHLYNPQRRFPAACHGKPDKFHTCRNLQYTYISFYSATLLQQRMFYYEHVINKKHKQKRRKNYGK